MDLERSGRQDAFSSLGREQIIDVRAKTAEPALVLSGEQLASLKARLKDLVANEMYAEAADVKKQIEAIEQTSTEKMRQDVQSKLASLQVLLDEAVANEKYAEAATLKDEIDGLSETVPVDVAHGMTKNDKLASLRVNLKKAVDSELYGLAAEIQDDIKQAEMEQQYQLTETRGPMQTYRMRKPAVPTKMVLTEEERAREDETPDSEFYKDPRMTLYVDMPFALRLQELYSKRIMSGASVLDLGAACATYLPEGLVTREVCGLGMNLEEMEANDELMSCTVQDLNEDTKLPFLDEQFDAVVCSNTLQYLIEPERVLEEVSRTLRPGGVIILSFTDKCFASKVTKAWSDRGNLARAHLVQDLVRACPGLTEPELVWEVNPLSSAGVMAPALRGVTGGDPFIAVVAYKDSPPPGWALTVAGQVAGKGGALGTVQAGPFKDITPFAAMYMLYLLINHAH